MPPPRTGTNDNMPGVESRHTILTTLEWAVELHPAIRSSPLKSWHSREGMRDINLVNS